MSDDGEIPVFYSNAQDGMLASAAAAQSQALKHFDCFLEVYCVQIRIKTVKAVDIPYRGIPRKSTDKAVSEFWDNLMGAFVTYLGKHARAACKPTGPLLSMSTTVGYCGVVKNFFVDTMFRHEPPIPVFQNSLQEADRQAQRHVQGIEPSRGQGGD
jgi:hypothetical protein